MTQADASVVACGLSQQGETATDQDWNSSEDSGLTSGLNVGMCKLCEYSGGGGSILSFVCLPVIKDTNNFSFQSCFTMISLLLKVSRQETLFLFKKKNLTAFLADRPMLVSSDDCKTIRPQHFETTAHILRMDQVNKLFFSFFPFLWLSMKSCGSGTVWPWPQLQLSIHHDKNSVRPCCFSGTWLVMASFPKS